MDDIGGRDDETRPMRSTCSLRKTGLELLARLLDGEVGHDAGHVNRTQDPVNAFRSEKRSVEASSPFAKVATICTRGRQEKHAAITESRARVTRWVTMCDAPGICRRMSEQASQVCPYEHFGRDVNTIVERYTCFKGPQERSKRLHKSNVTSHLAPVTGHR